MTPDSLGPKEGDSIAADFHAPRGTVFQLNGC